MISCLPPGHCSQCRGGQKRHAADYAAKMERPTRSQRTLRAYIDTHLPGATYFAGPLLGAQTLQASAAASAAMTARHLLFGEDCHFSIIILKILRVLRRDIFSFQRSASLHSHSVRDEAAEPFAIGRCRHAPLSLILLLDALMPRLFFISLADASRILFLRHYMSFTRASISGTYFGRL